jgi:hypothetical protein
MPGGSNQVRFDVQLHCRYPVAVKSSQWVRLWTGEISQDIRVSGTVHDLIRPIDSASVAQTLQDRLWVMGMDNTLRIIRTYGTLPELRDDTAIGLVFDLLRDGEPVARTSGWWGNNDALRHSEVLRWEWKAQAFEPARHHTGKYWSLRVRGDPHLALLAFDDRAANSPDAASYWSGQVMITLRIGDPSGYLGPSWDYVGPRRWGWQPNPASTQRE